MKDILKNILPNRLYSEIVIQTNNNILEEIRIRRGRQAYIVVSGQNIVLPIILNDRELTSIINCITNSSLYAHKETLNQGYISYEGVRIGVIGRAAIDNNIISAIYDINELSIRIPNKIHINCESLLDCIKSPKRSMLIYSPPGIGKTTLLRNIVKNLANERNGFRVCVVDTRNELSFDIDEKDLLLSFLFGYPRRNGIEIAIRCMNPQFIVCDEIGDINDASAITESQIAGVPLIATCHGHSISDILSHQGIRMLHLANIFDYYVGISRMGTFDMNFNINTWEEANDIFKDFWRN